MPSDLAPIAVSVAIVAVCVTTVVYLLLGVSQQIEDGRHRVATRKRARHAYRCERRARRRWRIDDLVQLTRGKNTPPDTIRVRVDHYLQSRATDLDQQADTARRRSVAAYFPPWWAFVLPIGIPDRRPQRATRQPKPKASSSTAVATTSRDARPAGMPF